MVKIFLAINAKTATFTIQSGRGNVRNVVPGAQSKKMIALPKVQ